MAAAWAPGRDGRPPSTPLLLLLLVLVVFLPLSAVRGEASLAICQLWKRSAGPERIRLGNAIGASAYLTKVHPFAVSDPEHPQLMYSTVDLKRACDTWR